MPCVDSGPNITEPTCKERLDKVTALLCATCRILEEKQFKKVPGLKKWWKVHQVEDAARLKSEAEQKVFDLNRATKEYDMAKAKLDMLRKKL